MESPAAENPPWEEPYLRLHEPTSGKVYFEGNDILSYDKNKMKELRREMQIIFQDPFASLNPENDCQRGDYGAPADSEDLRQEG